jgi:phage baseplate assembly protein W
MNPTFGSGVRDLIFEQQTDELTDQIEDLIIGGVEVYFPQVQINTLNVVQSPDNYTSNNIS